MTRTKTPSAVAAAALAALVLAAQALATPPVHRDLVVLGEEAPIDCGNGVVLTESYSFTSRRTTFFDSSGARTRFIDRNHYTLTVDFVGGTITVNGVSFRIRSADGGPVVVQDLGHIVFSLDTLQTIEMSSKHAILAAGFEATLDEAFCAAMA